MSDDAASMAVKGLTHNAVYRIVPCHIKRRSAKKKKKKKKEKKKWWRASLPDSLQLLFRTVEVLGSILAVISLTILVWTEDWTEGLVHRLNTKSVGPVYFAPRT